MHNVTNSSVTVECVALEYVIASMCAFILVMHDIIICSAYHGSTLLFKASTTSIVRKSKNTKRWIIVQKMKMESQWLIDSLVILQMDLELTQKLGALCAT